MSALDSLCLAVGFLWLAAAICWVMRIYHYFLAADLGMAAVLLCFSVLATIKHNEVDMPLPLPVFTGVAAAAQPSAEYVTRPGDGFYHTADCERLRIGVKQPYDLRTGGQRAPCIDCILPNRQRSLAKAAQDGVAVQRQPPR